MMVMKRRLWLLEVIGGNYQNQNNNF